MRMMLKVSLPVDKVSVSIKDCILVTKIQSILADFKPETAYFTEFDGKRPDLIFFDTKDTSETGRCGAVASYL